MANYTMHHLNVGSDTYEMVDEQGRVNIAPSFSASSTYAVGDMVLKDGQLYECNTAISTAEAWTAAHWTAVTVGGELSTVKDGLYAVFPPVVTLEYGSISGNGAITQTNTRVHTTDKFIAYAGDTVFPLWDTVNNYGRYYIETTVWNFDGSVRSQSGWKDNVYLVPTDGYISLTVRRRDNGTISASDIADMQTKVFFTHLPKNESNKTASVQVMKGINHRGWYQAPENTVVAYQESSAHGFKYVETDVRMTSDNVPVCLHDATINRTGRNADGSAISSTINISDITYSQTQEYDFGIWKGSAYAGTKMPKLAEVLNICKVLGMQLYVDIGSTPLLTRAQIQIIVDTVHDSGMVQNVTYLCGQLEYGVYISQYDKYARIGVVTSLNALFTTYALAFRTGYNDVFMNVELSNVSVSTLANAKANELPVEVWTVNTTSDIDSLDAYITGVTSDSIDASAYLKSQNSGAVPYIQPTAIDGRTTIMDGGYYVEGRKVYVNIKIKSSVNHTSTPGVLTNMPKPSTGWCALSCIRSDSNIGSTINSIIPCGINNIGVYAKELSTNGIYYITGVYLC